jgi:hypothetical protein
MERSLKQILARCASVLVDGKNLTTPGFRKMLTFRSIGSAQVRAPSTRQLSDVACFHFTGLHLADASVWLSAVMALAVFNISKVVENGVEITPEVDPSSGTIRYVAHLIPSAVLAWTYSSHPKPFKCFIEHRSVKALELIQQDASY